MTLWIAVSWVLDHWVIIQSVVNSVISLGLIFAHLANKANLAQVMTDVKQIFDRVDVKPADPDSAQVQSELKNPKV